MLFIYVFQFVFYCGFHQFPYVFIFFRLVEPSGDAHSTKDPRSFMQGVVMKIMDVIAKAKVSKIGSKISF